MESRLMWKSQGLMSIISSPFSCVLVFDIGLSDVNQGQTHNCKIDSCGIS